MSSLRELQKQFSAVLFGELADTEAVWVRQDGRHQLRGPRRAETAARLAIYRNNLQEGFTKALTLEFPVIQRLVGEDYFRQLAREYLHAHPSRAGDLHGIGASFGDYLHGRFAGGDYGYLPDVARLEWAYEQAAVAADAPEFDVRSLAGVAPEAYGELRFALHPACYTVKSGYPILHIWQVNQSESVDSVDLSTGPHHVATRRGDQRVEAVLLQPGEYCLLGCFAQGMTLAEASAGLQQSTPGSDLGCALRHLIALGMITGLRTDLPTVTRGIPS